MRIIFANLPLNSYQIASNINNCISWVKNYLHFSILSWALDDNWRWNASLGEIQMLNHLIGGLNGLCLVVHSTIKEGGGHVNDMQAHLEEVDVEDDDTYTLIIASAFL